jgi:hypothetical protein
MGGFDLPVFHVDPCILFKLFFWMGFLPSSIYATAHAFLVIFSILPRQCGLVNEPMMFLVMVSS